VAETPREEFKRSVEAAIRAQHRNISDRGLSGPDSALVIPYKQGEPALLDALADAAEAAYGAPAKRGRAS
jgi:hypothetical protein